MGNKLHLRIILGAMVVGLSPCQAQSSALLEPKAFSLASKDESVLQTLLKWGEREHLAMGFEMLDSGLCEQKISVNLYNASTEQVLNAVLKESNYEWSIKNGVIEIKAGKSQGDLNAKLLNLVIDRFTSLNTTTQGIGSQLRAIIGSTVKPGTGYAINVLSTEDAERQAPFTLERGSVEEILNKIVSLGSKGVWILYGTTDKLKDPLITGDVNLQIFGYKDDQYWLAHLSCLGK